MTVEVMELVDHMSDIKDRRQNIKVSTKHELRKPSCLTWRIELVRLPDVNTNGMIS